MRSGAQMLASWRWLRVHAAFHPERLDWFRLHYFQVSQVVKEVPSDCACRCSNVAQRKAKKMMKRRRNLSGKAQLNASGLLKREEVKSRRNKTHQPCSLANLPKQQQKICDFVILTRIVFAPQSEQDRENDFLSRRTITRRQCGSASFHHLPLCGPLRTYRPIQRFPMVFSTCHMMIYMTRPQCHASECPGCEAKRMTRRLKAVTS